ncbi:NAD(P)H-hydrate dehydratase [Motiliproteus sediminis]|uniref:NAD(P)H-hydrate dehydratase n=1 Tax=Motiliproteus sediminis TaxID=1468178 RepID=UPI001AEFEDC8|nr:NAD(P)H-hydrate dehydratase [Motiliproteus sediminis]
MPQADVRRPQLYTAEQTRRLDQLAIASGTPGFELMMRAGRASYRALRRRWPEAQRLLVLCGGGNNGGDGLVIAALALEQQLEVQVRMAGGEATRARLQGEALQALQWAEQRGVKVRPYDPAESIDADVAVDALLGTGLGSEVRGEYRQAIEQLNESGLPVLAVDIPSGLCADTGAVMGVAVNAAVTISFIGRKRGLMTNEGAQYRGDCLFDDLQVDDAVYAQVPTGLQLLAPACLRAWLPRRERNAHKGRYGHLLVVGGDHAMAGAVAMAAEAGLRSGAGLVSVATRAAHQPALNARTPELIVHGVRSGQDLEPLLQRPTVVVIGPGLGQSAWSGQLLHVVQRLSCPLVLDADALNLLDRGELVSERQRDNWVLTPHPGEAARLLGCSVADIQADRFAAVKRLQQRYGGVVVLKGAGTLVASAERVWVCAQGNPGMASGGMGDVLAGTMGALLAQGLACEEAAAAAVLVHALAADQLAASHGERGLLATDLLLPMRRWLNPDLFAEEV